MRKIESGAWDQESEEADDGTPSWRVEHIGEDAPWEAESFQKVR